MKMHVNTMSLKALEMVKYIHSEFLQMLGENEWMDKKTIDHAIEKAKTISTHIGYPDQLLDDDKVGELYENVSSSWQFCIILINLTIHRSFVFCRLSLSIDALVDTQFRVLQQRTKLTQMVDRLCVQSVAQTKHEGRVSFTWSVH